MTPARLPLWVALAAALAGLGVSIYLTAVHYSAAALVCSASGTIDCERVLTSPYGVIAGTSVPTSAAGLLWFLAAGALAGRRLISDEDSRIATAHLIWAGAGLVTVLGLVYIEIDRLGAICAWCTAAHACVLVTMLAVLWARR